MISDEIVCKITATLQPELIKQYNNDEKNRKLQALHPDIYRDCISIRSVRDRFYLPALPVLSEYFDTTASLVQLSLTFSMVGLAVGQLIIGPLSDKYGRKLPLMVSLVIFCISTVGCLYSPEIHGFIFARLLQGLSGAGGVVISKSIAIDLYQGKELTRFSPC